MTVGQKRGRGRPKMTDQQKADAATARASAVTAPPTARPVNQWVGASPSSMPPPRVRLRIFQAYKGVCQLSQRSITPQDKWMLDHKIALINGGANTEDNLWPVLTEPHKIKTAADVAEKAKVAAVAKKHLGIKGSKRTGLEGRSLEEKREAKAPPSGRIGLPPRRWDRFGNPL